MTTAKAVWLIIIVGLVIFCNGLFNGFAGDDQIQITRNVAVQSLDNIGVLFSGGTFYNGSDQALNGFSYKPFLNLSYAILFAIFGANAFGFHLFQITLFIINAWLLFLILKQFFKVEWSLLLSLIFLVHPINSEVAFYIADLQDALFFFFGALALLILQHRSSTRALVISGLLLFCSLMSKETGVLFLLVSWLYLYLYKEEYLKKFCLYSLVALGFYLFLRFSAVGVFSNSGLNSQISSVSLLIRMVNIPEMISFYIARLIFPWDLAMSYQWIYTKVDLAHFILPLILDLVALGLISGFGISLYQKRNLKDLKLLIFFTVWLLIGVGLHLQILPLDQTVSERWFYFPMVGVLGLLGILLERFKWKKEWVIYAGVTVVILLSARTFVRSFDWRSDLTLASHDVQVSKEAYGLENQLSSGYLEAGDYPEAKVHAMKSINLQPTTTSYIDLGVADTLLGDYGGARQAYMDSLKYGDYYISYEYIAALSVVSGDLKQNIDFIKNVALKKYPSDVKLWLYLAILEYNHGFVDQAKADIAQAYALNQSAQVSSVYLAMMNNEPVNPYFNFKKQ